jgi:tRNA A-37 threonylcarbamoyl transferase component Bud32
MDSVQSGQAEPAHPDAPPVLPDGLEVIRLLGVGKMARVYLARERELERVVAVKVLRPELATDETARLRFEREARSAASLTHPNVVPVYRFGRLDTGTPFLVMSYVQGRTLADRLQAEGTLSEGEARTLIGQLASALAAAHRKGIVHRDVRPANVLIEDESGRVLLSDFGIAALLEGGADSGPRITRTGQMVGEPRYSSPEQLRGDKVTGQADIYSLAILAYEVLAGEGPYRTTSKREAFAAHLTGEPRPITQLRPAVSRELEDLLLRCLAREPAHRPRAEVVAKRLEEGAAAGGGAGSTAGEGLGIFRRRIPQIVASTFAAGIVITELVSGLIQNGMLPQRAYQLSMNFAVWALGASAVLAWFHGAKGTQKTTTREKVILAVLGIGWIATTVWVLLR